MSTFSKPIREPYGVERALERPRRSERFFVSDLVPFLNETFLKGGSVDGLFPQDYVIFRRFQNPDAPLSNMELAIELSVRFLMFRLSYTHMRELCKRHKISGDPRKLSEMEIILFHEYHSSLYHLASLLFGRRQDPSGIDLARLLQQSCDHDSSREDDISRTGQLG